MEFSFAVITLFDVTVALRLPLSLLLSVYPIHLSPVRSPVSLLQRERVRNRRVSSCFTADSRALFLAAATNLWW